MNEKTKIIVIAGPTAVGKTALSIAAAKKINGEIISGDSMQIYKGLDIGTAKITKQEQENIPHYLLDEKEPGEAFTASDFKLSGRKAIEEIVKKGKCPIIVGGTGLYIESLLFDLSLGDSFSSDPEVRKQLEQKADRIGGLSIWEQLKKIDPAAAANIHPNNTRRVIRALEVFETTGKKMSEQSQKPRSSPYDVLWIGLTSDRMLLYERINSRVDAMISEGLIEEARQLFETVSPDSQAAKGIGYKEWFPYFENKISLEEAANKIKQHSRNYAKRQLTWFRNRIPEMHWFDLIGQPEKESEILDRMNHFCWDSNERKKVENGYTTNL